MKPVNVAALVSVGDAEIIQHLVKRHQGVH